MSDPNAHPLELISAFSDGELTSEEAVQIQEHLRACPDCRQVLHDIRRMSTAVGEEAVPAPPAGLAAAIRRRIESESGSSAIRNKVSFWKSPFPLATAAALILVTVAYLGWIREAPRQAPAGSRDAVSTGTPSSDSDAILSKQEEGKKVLAEQPPAGEPDATRGFSPVSPHLDDSARPTERDGETAARGDLAQNRQEPADSLRNLGYAADEKAKSSPPPGVMAAVPAAPLSKEAAGSAEAGQVKRSRTAAKDAAVAGGEVGGAMESEASPEELSEIAASQEARSLVYEGPDFSATFAEDGLVTVITRGYACSVSVAALTSPTPAGRPAPKSVVDLPSLFAAALSKEFQAAPSRPEDLVAAQGVARSSLLSTVTLRDGKGDPLHSVAFPEPLQDSTPEIVRSLRQGMQRLFGVRYRAELEKRCGPLPPVLAPAP